MADAIAVMNGGRIEQLGTPSELYERPRTAFVAGFLGVSNLLRGTVAGDGRSSSTAATRVRVPTRTARRAAESPSACARRRSRLGAARRRTRSRHVVRETAYIGVSTAVRRRHAGRPRRRLRPERRAGRGSVRAGDAVTLSLVDPTPTFVVDREAGGRGMTARSPAASCSAGRRRRRRCSRCRGSSPPAAGGGQRRGSTSSVARRCASRTGRSTSTTTRRRSAPDARPVHEEDGDQGRVHRGHQRQRVVFGKIQAPLSQGQSIDRDIIVLTDNSPYPALLVKKGWVEKLDKKRIPNIKNLDRRAAAARPATRTATTASPGSPA